MSNELNQTAEQANQCSKKNHKHSFAKKIIVGCVIFFVIAAGVVGVGFTYKALQFKKQMEDDGPLGMMLERITKDLNLTDQQKTQVEDIKKTIKDKRESNRQLRENGMSEFENAFRQDNLSKETLKSMHEKYETEIKEMKEFYADQLVRFHSILTSEQRNKVADKMKEFREKRKEFHMDFDDRDKRDDRMDEHRRDKD